MLMCQKLVRAFFSGIVSHMYLIDIAVISRACRIMHIVINIYVVYAFIELVCYIRVLAESATLVRTRPLRTSENAQF